jgi:anthranilate synthase component 2
LIVRNEGFPGELSVTAVSEDGLVMAIAHRSKPVFGVQFHPESVLTPQGGALLANFLAVARAHPSLEKIP